MARLLRTARAPMGLRMSRLWNAGVILWAIKAIMPELSLRVPFVFVHKGRGLDNGGGSALDVNGERSAWSEPDEERGATGLMRKDGASVYRVEAPARFEGSKGASRVTATSYPVHSIAFARSQFHPVTAGQAQLPQD
ncbi:hypothetical protein C8R21_10958 [Nitrosospira multiformis]|uniref:Uncharacterized protein n=1 Tax=Nitrosospira multiformis TaxID=1231 RepID=A0A2T5ICE7_9PROT|nr:hypothetical protein C8R21_10958 [Nitrosospira multiformis]